MFSIISRFTNMAHNYQAAPLNPIEVQNSVSGETMTIPASDSFKEIAVHILVSKLWDEKQDTVMDLLNQADIAFLSLFIQFHQGEKLIPLSANCSEHEGQTFYTILSNINIIKYREVLREIHDNNGFVSLNAWTPTILKEHEGFVRYSIKNNPDSVVHASDTLLTNPLFRESLKSVLSPHNHTIMMHLMGRRGF